MQKKGNNPAQDQFTDRELELIDDITLTMADIAGQHSRRDYDTPKKMNKAYREMTSSKKGIDRLALTLNLLSMYGKEEGAFHEQINKEINEISKAFLEHSKYIVTRRSRLSKLLKEFEEKRILHSIKGKKNIKRQSPKSMPRKSKFEAKRVGYPALYKLEPIVEDYIKILSNPKALELINEKLVKHGSLEKAYDLIFRNALELFKNQDERFFNFLFIFKRLFPNLDPATIPDPKLAQQVINSTAEQDLEAYRKEFVHHFLENPHASLFFVFSLTKFEDNI